MNAVITAGGPIGGEFALLAGTDRKALAPVRGRTLIARTIEALVGCGIERIAVVGNDAVGAECGALAPVKMVRDAGSGGANVLGALDAWPDDAALLYLTCDLPYIDERALQWFLERIDPCALSMPLTAHDAFSRRFPGAPPFGITLAGERVVNGGVFHLPAGSRARIRALASMLFDARKAPWKMAAIAGPSVLVRFAFRQLSVAALEARAQRVLDVPVAAVRDAPPELAYDIDVLTEYRYALDHA
ncbi:MAG TPA: nucleotidyltransferase family protein [Candidatus Baltobacteraceae bacterium]|nr:nucleotidyltransferase family protein [Candidatus Baltobacteraceae bacterium]